MDNLKREKILRDAISVKLAEGWTIRSGVTYILHRKECCPIGALLTATDKFEFELLGELNFSSLAKKYLEADLKWAYGFVNGFDKFQNHPFHDPESYDLGCKLRKEFIG